ncbi:hypothetical protein OE88DRAFT_1213871 [Heliocybe sulcata]|uniref:Uncharacterized protein n=1 Tax=Heliocybe sulcata TaxID=5364 RepID=A0A5C3MKM3_9AGAM|nr:hypothetical protein OE88DRAFT_1213871 [Heliocybe sulcata]
MASADDLSLVELRGPAFEWLGPGGRITIQGVEYEYADSEADDDSINDAVGPGKTFGKLVKRVSAPLEMFLSICSDLLGNGPDATFTRVMRREYPSLWHYKRTKRLSWWIHESKLNPQHIWPLSKDGIGRLVQFVIDRRYNLSVRLTAAYYLLLLLQWTVSHRLCTILPLIHDPLLRLCQEGSRNGIASMILQPLQEAVSSKEDLTRIGSCKLKEIPAAIMYAPALCVYRCADSHWNVSRC